MENVLMLFSNGLTKRRIVYVQKVICAQTSGVSGPTEGAMFGPGGGVMAPWPNKKRTSTLLYYA